MKNFISFLVSRAFWINLFFILLAFFLIIFIAFQALKYYTNHGERLRMPDYTLKKLDIAKKDAEDRTFEIIVQDSIFLVDKPGNLILNQNPKPESFVKEGRKIYVTVTKVIPEVVNISDLPRFYGENFDIKSEEIKIGYEIESEIIARAYDPGPENHILAVLYKKDTIITKKFRKKNIEIEKGQTLQFVVSEKKGGMVPLPNLVCRTYGEARFLLSTFDIDIEIETEHNVDDFDHMYITSQFPPYDPNQNIRMGDVVKVKIAEELPIDCETSYE